MYDPNAVKIYTDGSAQPNPGIGGIGLVIELPENLNLPDVELSEGFSNSNNQRMELRACMFALEWLQSQKFTRGIIITDSDYVYSNYEHVSYWKKKDWVKPGGMPYENKDLWDSFLKERQKIKFPIEIKWEKGKTREVLKRVDKLAKNATKGLLKTDYGYQAGKFTAPRTFGGKAATLYIPQNKKELIRIYRKNIYGKNENSINKIFFEIYDKSELKYISKHVAYQGKDCIILERNNCYEVTFNDDPKFPQIIEAIKVEYLK